MDFSSEGIKRFEKVMEGAIGCLPGCKYDSERKCVDGGVCSRCRYPDAISMITLHGQMMEKDDDELMLIVTMAEALIEDDEVDEWKKNIQSCRMAMASKVLKDRGVEVD